MKQNKQKHNRYGGRRTGVLSLCLILLLVMAATLTGCGKKESVTETADSTVSGEPVATQEPELQIPPASSQNDLLKIATEAKGSENKICYLTFDDGPTKTVTTEVLDVLKKYDVKATFFMLGSMIEKNPDIAKRAYQEGHLLANHSYSHKYGELYASGKSFMGEIKKVNDLIQEVTGAEPFKLVRFPGGSFSGGSYGAKKQEYKELLQKEGYYYADWNSLNGDAEGGKRSPAQLVERVKETVIHNNTIVLMHDATGKESTAKALPDIIEYLKGEGYEFRRLDEISYYGEEGPEEEQEATPEQAEYTDGDMIL